MGLFLGVAFGCLYSACPAAFQSPTDLLVTVTQLWVVPADRLGVRTAMLLPSGLRGLTWFGAAGRFLQHPEMVGSALLLGMLVCIRRLSDVLFGHAFSS